MTQNASPSSSRASNLAALRHYIEAKRRENVSRIPSEAHLSEELGISRARLRGLLKKLEQEGLIWRHVGKGTFIGERSLTGDLDSMPDVLTPPEAFEARMLVEPQIAALAAQRATPAQIEKMRDCIAEMERLSDFDQWAVIDERLHRMIAKAANNRLLLAIYDTVRESAPSGMRNIVNRAFSSDTREESNEEHKRFIDAIAEHDSAQAESHMRNHLLAIRQIIFGSF